MHGDFAGTALALRRSPMGACATSTRGYARREPEKDVLYRVVAANVEIFVAAASSADAAGIPRHVRRGDGRRRRLIGERTAIFRKPEHHVRAPSPLSRKRALWLLRL